MALAALVLSDGQTTPGEHTFSEVTEFPFASWAERLGISIGEPTVSISASRPSAKRKSQKTIMRVQMPVLETISGDVGGYTPTPRVAFTMLAEMTFVSPDRSTLQQRKDLYAFASGLLAKEMVKAMVVDQAPAA